MSAMMSATSLASQQFSGRRRSFSTSTSSSSSTNESRIRFSSSVRAPRGVTARVGLGKAGIISLVDPGTHVGFNRSSQMLNGKAFCYCAASVHRYDAAIEAKRGNPPVMPAVMSPAGPLDLSSVLFRNRIIFIGQPINSQVAQRVISQLVTLATIDEDADILIYLNCPGGSTYSVLAIYDCMLWIKPKVGTICFGVAASQGALLLAGGEKGMRYAMPNARVMIHQPQGGCGGHVEDVRRQVNEAVQTRHKVDKMYAAFTGQSLEKVQQYTERDRFLSASEALEFGLIDGLLETEY